MGNTVPISDNSLFQLRVKSHNIFVIYSLTTCANEYCYKLKISMNKMQYDYILHLHSSEKRVKIESAIPEFTAYSGSEGLCVL